LIGRALTHVYSLALSLVFAGAAASLPAATNSAKASGAQEELRQLKSRIDSIQKRLAEAEESKSEAADALQESERAISDANRSVAELSGQARDAAAKAAELKRDMERAESELTRQRATLAKLLYQQYVTGRPETLAVLLNGGDPNAIARELHYLTYIGRARGELIAALHENVARLQALAAEAQGKALELAAITNEQARQRKRLEQEKRARAQVLTRISRDIEQQRREIGTLRRDEARLTRLIEQLARMIAKTPRPRAAPEAKPRNEPRITNERVPERERDEGPFARLRGKLALPVRGELANRFGSPRQDGGVVWKGLFIAAPGGEEVRAIAAGRVVFADWLRGFGNLLIIDHGDSYMSLYGYNETLYRQVGDVIRGGDRIAAVGNSGGHADSGLYFEIRHEGRPFDPMTWVLRK
jgi:septal ring factor EnvC (AmiA/AmiB activator)